MNARKMKEKEKEKSKKREKKSLVGMEGKNLKISIFFAKYSPQK